MSNQNFENEVSPLTVRLVNLVEQAEEPYHHQFKPKEFSKLGLKEHSVTLFKTKLCSCNFI